MVVSSAVARWWVGSLRGLSVGGLGLGLLGLGRLGHWQLGLGRLALGVLSAGVLSFAALTSVPGLASARAATSSQVRRVAVLPVRDYNVAVTELFQTARQPAPRSANHAEQIVHALASHPGLQVLSPEAVQSLLTRDQGLDAVIRTAQARYRLGLEYFMGLSPARAVQSLRESARLYRQAFRDLSASKSLADALFMLGVSLLDAGETAAAHVAMKRGFQVQPGRRFRPGLFPKAAEQALQQALIDHLSTGPVRRPFGDKERLHRLAQRLNVTAVVTVSRGGAEDRLHVSAYRPDVDRFDLELSVPLPQSASRVEAALSRWVACLPPPKQATSGPPPTPSFRLDTAGNYTFYLRQPTRRPFHSLGFGAGVARSVGPGLEWFVRVHMLTSLSDPYRDLLYTFNSLRAVVGVGFIIKRRGYRLWARPGLDLHALGRFVATTDPECKLFGEQHPLCSSATIRDLEQNVLFGFHLSLGAEVDLGRRFFVLAQLAGSAYVLPFSKADDLNFPLALDLGLGYRF